MLKFTPEQHEVLDWVVDGQGILLVAAGPGTGKSFLAEQVVRQEKPVTGLYTAFNKAIVEEGVGRFQGTGVQCKTLHALALGFVRPYLKNTNIQDLSYTCITEKLTYTDKAAILDAINDFYVSSDVDMIDYFAKVFPKQQKLADTCVKYVDQMIEGEVSPTFNFLLKYFHLLLVEGTENPRYDIVILDEINDTTAVSLEIFKLLEAPKKLGLGETHQAIYEFLKLVNGFEELKDVPIYTLTQSFRCSEEIANQIQNFMRSMLKQEFTFVGTNEPVANKKTLYCTLTNARIIMEISERLKEGKGFTLLRKISEIFAYPMAIITASQGKEPFQKKFKFLQEEYKSYQRHRKAKQSYMQYLLDNVDDVETQNAVRLLLTLQRKGINLFALYKEAKESPVDPDYTIATVYTSKGLEFEKVWIADDLNSRIQDIKDRGGIETRDDLIHCRCYYVACSRAGKYLENAQAL